MADTVHKKARGKSSPGGRQPARTGWQVALLLLVLAAAVPVGLYLARGSEEPAPTAPQAVAGRQAAAGADSEGEAPEELAGREPEPKSREELVAHLRSRYGPKLGNAYVQVRMLESLIGHFRKREGSNWEAALLALLKEAFPAQYEELAERLRQRVGYEEWMKANRERLAALEDKARREAVWAEREQRFGREEAREIWASELRNQALREALVAIDERPGASLGERLGAYRQSLEAIHGDKAQAWLERHRQEAMNHFLELGSVQQQLGALGGPERAQALREVREGLGLDAAALERWEALDQERDRRWEQGLAYMAEREALAKQYSGAELEARLAQVRARYLGAEADTVAQEEQSGYFRFSRPRRWGRE
jgi:hypothetical protein